jgi:hypothetical protein
VGVEGLGGVGGTLGETSVSLGWVWRVGSIETLGEKTFGDGGVGVHVSE